MTRELFFRDPYILDFLDLKDTYNESDLENAIIRELEKFKPEHKGQVELYLNWLNKYEKAEGEESPIAIILCATKSDTMTELLGLENSGIHVAQYLTKYVPKEVLEEKFLSSIKNAKIQLEQRKVKNTSV